MAAPNSEEQTPKSPLQEIVQPFVDLVHAPRALWGINLAYTIEGMVYFGMLGYLAMYFSDYVFKGIVHADEWSHGMVMVLTSGITISMFFLGTLADRWGVRRAILGAFVLMLAGRALLSAGWAPLQLQGGLWSPLHLVSLAGMLLIVIGYGMYQPAAYAGVRQFTTPKTAAMGFAMLYALMNLGGWLPTFAFFFRDEEFLGLGIPGTFWVYTGFTAAALAATWLILTRKVVADATTRAKAEREAEEGNETVQEKADREERIRKEAAAAALPKRVPVHMVVALMLLAVFIAWRYWGPWGWGIAAFIVLLPAVIPLLPASPRSRVVAVIAAHPFANARFFFFIFALIPVQTLFTYNWLILPQYINRAYTGWIGQYFEIAANANPLLIFVLVPIIAAATRKMDVYKMMIIGTTVMAGSAAILAFGANPYGLLAYILFMTLGEAIWQPRFLQYAAEIAPEGRTGEYMGVAQLPWFLTKVLVPLLYSGYMIERYCPPAEAGLEQRTGTMWGIFFGIAIISPILLVVAQKWVRKDFKVKAA